MLIEEYKRISEAYEKHAQILYGLPPAFILLSTGFLFHKVPAVSFFAFVIPVVLLISLIFVSYVHGISNYYGLRLVEIEQKINSTKKNTKLHLSFYSQYIAEGARAIPQLKIDIILLIIIDVALLIMSCCLIITKDLGKEVQFFHSTGLAIIVAVPNLFILANTICLEFETRKQKLKILSNTKKEEA